MTKLSKKARRLAFLTIAALRRSPRHYAQWCSWGHNGGHPTCGSPACIIGWMMHYATLHFSHQRRTKAFRNYRQSYRGASTLWLLGLTYDQITHIYNADRWPGRLSMDNSDAKPRCAIRRLNHLLKTGE